MKPLSLRARATSTTSASRGAAASATTSKAPASTMPPAPPPRHEPLPLPATPTVVAKQAGQGEVPAWATPAYFQQLANADAGSPLKGGRGLQVRLQAMSSSAAASSAASSTTKDEATRQRGLGLLQRALHGVGVMGGRPLTAAEIAEAPPALHLTKPEAVDSILTHGLRPTTGLYKNLTTWFRKAVYMFGREPTAAQKFVNFSTAAAKATATIEIDLKKLDPEKLYKRVLDGAIIYVSDTPIPADALRVRSGP
jgi:hypothetical protein